MGFQSTDGALDLNDDGMMWQFVQQCGHHHWVAEHFRPHAEASIRGQDYGALFIYCTDRLEEQVGAFLGQRQIVDLIDDEQSDAAEELQFDSQNFRMLCRRQGLHQFCQFATINAYTSFHCYDTQCRGQMTFPGFRRAQKMHHFTPLNKVKRSQRINAILVQ